MLVYTTRLSDGAPPWLEVVFSRLLAIDHPELPLPPREGVDAAPALRTSETEKFFGIEASYYWYLFGLSAQVGEAIELRSLPTTTEDRFTMTAFDTGGLFRYSTVSHDDDERRRLFAAHSHLLEVERFLNWLDCEFDHPQHYVANAHPATPIIEATDEQRLLTLWEARHPKRPPPRNAALESVYLGPDSYQSVSAWIQNPSDRFRDHRDAMATIAMSFTPDNDYDSVVRQILVDRLNMASARPTGGTTDADSNGTGRTPMQQDQSSSRVVGIDANVQGTQVGMRSVRAVIDVDGSLFVRSFDGSLWPVGRSELDTPLANLGLPSDHDLAVTAADDLVVVSASLLDAAVVVLARAASDSKPRQSSASLSREEVLRELRATQWMWVEPSDAYLAVFRRVDYTAAIERLASTAAPIFDRSYLVEGHDAVATAAYELLAYLPWSDQLARSIRLAATRLLDGIETTHDAIARLNARDGGVSVEELRDQVVRWVVDTVGSRDEKSDTEIALLALAGVAVSSGSRRDRWLVEFGRSVVRAGREVPGRLLDQVRAAFDRLDDLANAGPQRAWLGNARLALGFDARGADAYLGFPTAALGGDLVLRGVGAGRRVVPCVPRGSWASLPVETATIEDTGSGIRVAIEWADAPLDLDLVAVDAAGRVLARAECVVAGGSVVALVALFGGAGAVGVDHVELLARGAELVAMSAAELVSHRTRQAELARRFDEVARTANFDDVDF